MDYTISLLTEVPEVLHDGLKEFLEVRPDWDQDRVMTAALSLFLLQNRGTEAVPTYQRQASRVYLDTLFNASVADRKN
jgi:hypothetical protein